MLATPTILRTATLAAGLTIGAAAWAQQSSPSVDDQDLQKFANAASEVVQVKQKWLPTIIGQTTPADQERAQQQAMEEMTQVVRKNGLSVDQYNQIADAAKSDPDLQRRIEERLPAANQDESEDSQDPPNDEM